MRFVICLWLMMLQVWLLPALRLETTTGIPQNQSIELLKPCEQPKVPGLCKGRQLRYAYNKQTGNCESFYYTGCASTENNFMTYEECRRDCMQQLRY